MNTLQQTTLVVLMSFLSNLSFAQDHLAFTAEDGYGVYAYNLGHAIPGDPCDLLPNAVAFFSLASADLAPTPAFPVMNAALKLKNGGVGFTNFTTEISSSIYTLDDVEMKFTPITLGNDIEFQDWFMIDVMETRFYYNGTFTFYVADQPIVTGTMPVFKLEIDYQDMANCNDDIIHSVTQYTSIVDASAGQSQDIKDIAAALLTDVGSKSIRFTFSQMQAAIVLPDEYIFESASGKIELGTTFDDMSATSIDEPTANICTTPSSTITSTGSGNWLHVLNGADRVVSILDAENMGLITTEFYVNSGTVRSTTGGLEYMDRNFKITPTTQPTVPIRVRLYFTDSEWQDFSNALPTDLEAMSDIAITKFTASDCSEINNASGEVDLTVLDYGYIPTDNSYYLDVEVNSFSSFFVHGPKSSVILPVELVSFHGKSTNRGVQLNWQTASETNNKGFEIQRSYDGNDWRNIGWSDGKGSTTIQQQYSFLDDFVQTENLIYYRLKQIDLDGKYEFSSILSIHDKERNNPIGDFYPNPTTAKKVNLDYFSSTDENLQMVFYDVMGKTTAVKEFEILEGANHLNFNLQNFQQGIYVVEIQSRQGRVYRKLLVE